MQQEYECLFTALEGLVYPDCENAVVERFLYPALIGRAVGSDFFGLIDWTFGDAGSSKSEIELEVVQPRDFRIDVFAR